MKASLRQTLADSHVAAVAIAFLLLWSLDDGFRALWAPLPQATVWLATGIAIRGIPDSSFPLGLSGRFILISALSYLFGALISLVAAWLMSRWVFGVGPLRCLAPSIARFAGRNRV